MSRAEARVQQRLVDTPQHVVISGASSGIGEALAQGYAAPGRILSLLGRDRDRLQLVAERCRALGAKVDWLQADITHADTIARWVSARDQHRSVDLVIASAGMGGLAAVPTDLVEPANVGAELVQTNLQGAINLVAPLVPLLAARSYGQIVLIGSISGDVGLPQSPIYCATKAAVRVYGEALRRLLRPRGVSVMTVLPGFVDTPMSRTLSTPLPFCWSAEAAAQRIIRDAARGSALSIFPWQLRLAVGLHRLLPAATSDWILERLLDHYWVAPQASVAADDEGGVERAGTAKRV